MRAQVARARVLASARARGRVRLLKGRGTGRKIRAGNEGGKSGREMRAGNWVGRSGREIRAAGNRGRLNGEGHRGWWREDGVRHDGIPSCGRGCFARNSKEIFASTGALASAKTLYVKTPSRCDTVPLAAARSARTKASRCILARTRTRTYFSCALARRPSRECCLCARCMRAPESSRTH